MANTQPRNRAVIFRVTQEEYNRLEAACVNGGARSLSDFARSRVLSAAPSNLSNVEEKLDEIKTVVQQLARAIGKA
jgi:hypothetical protein